MVWAPDSTDLWAPDSGHPDLWASDSRGQLTLGRAVELFLAAKAAEGASPRTTEWYRMILVRLVRALGPGRSVDGLDPAELRAWLVEQDDPVSSFLQSSPPVHEQRCLADRPLPEQRGVLRVALAGPRDARLEHGGLRLTTRQQRREDAAARAERVRRSCL
jgi:hypothetical protein